MKLQEPEHAAVGKLNAHHDMLKFERVKDLLKLSKIAAMKSINTNKLTANTSSCPLIVT